MQEDNAARKQPPPENLPSGPPPEEPEASPLQRPQPTPPPPPPSPQPPPPPPSPPPSPGPAQQKQPYLQRGEVRTMQKDAVRLREEEAKKEQQRIAALKAQQEAQKEREAVQRIRATAQETKQKEQARITEERRRIQDSILPPGEERRVRDLPSPPSGGKKVFVRVVVIIIFAFIALNLALFAAWFFFFRSDSSSFQIPQLQFPEIAFPRLSIPFLSEQKDPSSTPAPSPQPTPPPPPPSPQPPQSQKPGESIAQLLQPSRTSTLQFSEADELAALLSSELAASEEQGGFTELAFRNKSDNAFLRNASEFLALFGAQPPVSLTPHLQNDTVFFFYSYERGNRFGLITKTQSPETASDALAQWEARAEQDLAPLLSFWGQPGVAYTTSFRSATHQGVEIRFQTFSLQDFGIVYAVVDDYLILASSYEAAKAAIDKLQGSAAFSSPSTLAVSDAPALANPPPKLSTQQAIGQVLMVGFSDSTLTPELEDLLKRLQPGGVLLLSANIKTAEQLSRLTQDLQRVSLEYSQLPLFIAVDQEGGAISRIDFGTEKTAQSTIENTDQAYHIGEERGAELKSLGVNLNLSPVLDSTEPGDFLFDRTFQAGRVEAGELAKALLAGQKASGILSTLKHFPGYGGISFNPEQKLATVSDFPDISPFVFALPANPEFLLTSNVIYSDFDATNPFSFSLKGSALVRSEFGFTGIILSDDLTQPSLLNNYSLETIATAPLRAGTNMLMFSKQSYATKAHALLQERSKTDAALRSAIEQSAARLLDIKKRFFYGLNPPAREYDHLSQN